jgi:hypothetical protein
VARAYHKALPEHSHAEHKPVPSEHSWQGQQLIDLRDAYDHELLHRFYECVGSRVFASTVVVQLNLDRHLLAPDTLPAAS